MADLDKLAADFVASGCEPVDTEPADSESAAHHHGEDGPARTHGHGDTVRRFRHRGHDVEIVTHYDVTIDSKPWERHLGVLNDGSVVYRRASGQRSLVLNSLACYASEPAA